MKGKPKRHWGARHQTVNPFPAFTRANPASQIRVISCPFVVFHLHRSGLGAGGVDGLDNALYNANVSLISGLAELLPTAELATDLTTDDTGTEKPDPAFFHCVFAHVAGDGGSKDDILHTAQSQYHDIGISHELGMTNVWIQRRFAQAGYGGTIEPPAFTAPDYHFHALIELADAADVAFDA